ncbi:hypothetical protein M222_2245 [Enterococcus faecalis AZ19]|uniref:hypothetical protein n=1 Tax=Enterococcus faecalis TaxID=1351 RepID=UPI00045A7D46|nr:hypothetical protein [Enterococcus faecalis]KAJ72475.1 hypothetical protein M222_2245 [Enterococcus faecalis AZ19]
MGKALTEQLKYLDTTSLASKFSSLPTVNMKDVMPSTEKMINQLSIGKEMSQVQASVLGK